MSGESLRNTGSQSQLYHRSLLGMIVAMLLLGCGLGALPAEATVPSTAIRYFYTPNNRLSAVIKPEAEYALYTWDAAGNLSSIKRASSTKLSIIQLEPVKGAVGETVDIWGTGFSTTPANDTVKFNGTAATVSAATADTLAVKVPSGATTGTVTVQTTTEGPVTSAQSFMVSSSAVPGVPTITSFSASVAAAGTVVTITGTGFETNTEDDYVTVNRSAAEATSATSTALKFVVPEGTSSGKVSVSTPYGSVVGPYLYIPPPGYTTAEIGPTLNLTSSKASTVNITTSGTVALATIEDNNDEDISAVLAKAGFSGDAYVYGTNNAELGGGAFFSKSEEKLMEAQALSLPGTYTILIAPSEGTGSIEVTSYVFNNATGSITPTTGGATEKVSLSTPGQVGDYSVPVESGEEVSVNVSEFSFGGVVRLQWLSDTGEVVSESETSSNTFNEPLAFSSAGTYTLRVFPFGRTGALKLTLYNATKVSYGSITPTAEGESKTVTTSVPGQKATVTFSGKEGEEISLKASESTLAAGSVTVSNAEGSAEASGGISGLTGPFTLKSTGTYTITVEGSETDTGSVKLTAYAVHDVTGSISPTTGGATETVSLPTPGQKASYSVPVTAGEEVSVKVSEFTFSGEVRFEWVNSGGTVVDEFETASNTFVEPVSFSASGTYTLRINPFNRTGSMKLTLYNATAVTGSITPSSGGESKIVTTSVPGQKAKITFSGTAEKEISLVLSEATYSYGGVTVLNPEGGVVASGGLSGTIGPFTLKTTGTYTIVIAFSEGATGSVKLTAYIGSPPHGLVVKAPSAPTSHDAQSNEITPTGGPLATSLQSTSTLAPGTTHVHRGLRTIVAHKVRKRDAGTKKLATSGRGFLSPQLRSFRPSASAVWYPRIGGGEGWSTGQPASPWANLASPIPAGSTITALAGQALKLNGLPLVGLHVAVQGTSTVGVTDTRGQFLLRGLPAGHQVLIVEGGTIAGQRYGTFAIGVQITAHQETTLDAPIWMTPLDPAGNHRIASPTQGPVTITTPRIPGLEVRLPAGTVIRDASGRIVHGLNITPVPVDRPPFPLPLFDPVPLYFTVQPGRAYLNKGAQIIYPNYGHLRPGQRVPFWNYDPDGRGWYVYGEGTVTPSGKQVVPDPGVRIWEFTGAMINKEPKPPHRGPKHGGKSIGGDPVDLGTGLFDYHRTDLVIPDTIPIVIERTYRQEDSNSYSFGVGTESLYDMRLWSENNYHEADLVLPDGGTILYKRVSPGEGYKNAEYKATNTPSIYYGSTIKWNESLPGWDLTLTNGTTYIFGELAPLQAIRNRQGQQLTITRSEGQKGNITMITSPHGRWVKFTYNSSNAITEIKDNSGRTLKYAYNKEGLLESATDPAERTTKYGYNSSGEMTSITDPRGNKYIENEYESHGLISKQKMGNGGVFEFSYTTNGEGNVESTTVTEPRETKRKVTFNTEGYPTSETRALGSSIEQKTTFERQANTGFLLSSTDVRSRKTAYEYDSYGNVTAVTDLAGTSSAQTYKYSYEPGTNELTKETDPLGHSTTYEYNSLGERVAKKDALGHTTTYEYNSDGQPSVIKDPLGHKTTITYEHGEPASITDPLGRTTKQFVDTAGRVLSTTVPGGQTTTYEYNKDNQPTKAIDSAGDETTYEYDADGDLTATTDPLKNKAKFAYTKMDLLESEEDALSKKTSAVYDTEGNLTELTDRRGKVDKFTYDALNRLTEVKYGVSGETTESTIKYEYDNGSRLTKIIDSASGTYTPEYDELNRLKSLATPQGTIKYEYDEANRRTSMTVPGQEAVKYTYDEASRLKELKRGTQAVSFAYNEDNLPTTTTLPDGIEEQYGYDEANELTSLAYKKSSTTLGELDYSYDLDGRKEATWGSYARTGLPEAVSSAKYNADNEQTERGSKKFSYDADGNMTSDGTNTYTWNARNQLAEITGGTKASFGYSPFGQRVSRTLSGTTTELLNDGPNVVQEIQSGKATANMLTGLLPSQVFTRTTSKATENLLTDQLGSTIALANSSGSVETAYTYDPFGTATKEGTGSENTMQYAGQENDGDGLNYDRARYYSPAAARFLSQDPTGQEGSGPNLYLYINDSPTNATDPYGTTACHGGLKGESLSADGSWTRCRNIEESNKREEGENRRRQEEEEEKNKFSCGSGGGTMMGVIQSPVGSHCSGTPGEEPPAVPTPDTPPPQPVPGWGPSLPSLSTSPIGIPEPVVP